VTTPELRIRYRPRLAHQAPGEGFAGPAAARATADIRSWPGYRATPLVSLPGLARELGVAAISAKHEGCREPLRSFKMLGAPLALMELARTLVGPATAAELMGGLHAAGLAGLTAVCASDGNHGRALAWAASRLGCRARIYLPEAVSEGRAEAIRSWGAEVVRVAGNYDETVARAAADAKDNGWHVISDMAYPGYEMVPRTIMHGYTLLAEEIADATPADQRPTHVFLQVGCGGMAAAVISGLRQAWSEAPPAFVSVEPLEAACLLEAAEARRPVMVEGDHATIMGGLACGEVSSIAWDYLAATVDHYVAIGDEAAVKAMRLLASPDSDPPLVVGETGGAGLGALLAALENPPAAEALGLGPDSRILLVLTEGATDPAEYQRIVGRPAASIDAGQMEFAR
jgi:diaminopropionate ammonia-lyase